MSEATFKLLCLFLVNGFFFSASEAHSDTLQFVELMVNSKKYKNKYMFGTITEKDEHNDVFKDPCSGDSGGPLVVLGPTHHILIGRDILNSRNIYSFSMFQAHFLELDTIVKIILFL